MSNKYLSAKFSVKEVRKGTSLMSRAASVVIGLLLAFGCAPSKEVDLVQGPKGDTGAPGAPGAQGPQGPGITVITYDFTGSSCMYFMDDNMSVKLSGTTFQLFNNLSCAGSPAFTIPDGQTGALPSGLILINPLVLPAGTLKVLKQVN